MIRFIHFQETLPIRSSELRKNLDPELCHFPGDEEQSSFHIGYFNDQSLISVASFHQVNREELQGVGYQLRGMATLPEFRGRGIGADLLKFSIDHLKGLNINYLWCNARKTAYHFYQSLGFEFLADEFDAGDIGLHRAMYLRIL